MCVRDSFLLYTGFTCWGNYSVKNIHSSMGSTNIKNPWNSWLFAVPLSRSAAWQLRLPPLPGVAMGVLQPTSLGILASHRLDVGEWLFFPLLPGSFKEFQGLSSRCSCRILGVQRMLKNGDNFASGFPPFLVLTGPVSPLVPRLALVQRLEALQACWWRWCATTERPQLSVWWVEWYESTIRCSGTVGVRWNAKWLFF